MSGWDIIALLLMLFGSIMMVIAGIGLLRMPDLYLRMSAATKVSTVGVASLLLAVCFHFLSLTVTAQAVATIAFLLLTAPVGAHIIGRAALHKDQVELYEGTLVEQFDHSDDKPIFGRNSDETDAA